MSKERAYFRIITSESLDDEGTLVLHVEDRFVGDENVDSPRSEEEERVEEVAWKVENAEELVSEGRAREELQVDAFPEGDIRLEGEIEAELGLRRGEGVEEPDAVGDAAYLDEVVARQTQNVRGREGREGRDERVEASSTEPAAHLGCVCVSWKTLEVRIDLQNITFRHD